MGVLLELLFDLALEGSMEIAKSEKAPKWLRYPLIVLLSLLILTILGGVIALSVVLIVGRRDVTEVALAVVLLVLDGVMISSVVKKARAYLIKRREKAAAEAAQEAEETDK